MRSERQANGKRTTTTEARLGVAAGAAALGLDTGAMAYGVGTERLAEISAI